MTDQLYIAHHTSGRIRFKLPQAKTTPASLERLKESLSPLPGIRRVDVKPLSGSIIVYYDPEYDEMFLSRLAEYGYQARSFTPMRPPNKQLKRISKSDAEAQYLAEQSLTGSSVLQAFRQLSVVVNKTTNGAIDLRELFPFAIGFYAFFFVDRSIGAPLWLSMMFFSWNSFIDLHEPEPSQYLNDSLQALRDEIASLRGELRAALNSGQDRDLLSSPETSNRPGGHSDDH